MSMIEIKRDKTDVVISVETDLPHNPTGDTKTTLLLRFETREPYLAEALARYLRERLRNAIENIRRDAYNKGWEDKTKRRPHATYFEEWL